MENKLSKADWLKAARITLLHEGPDAVRVEPIARALGVTKGSFYWHFTDRNDLLEALVAEWEEETSLLTDAIDAADQLEPFDTILDEMIEELHRRNLKSERGEMPSDAAIFAWAALDPAVAKRANKAEEERIALFRRLVGQPELADLFYYAYHGFLLRRRRVPKASGDFRTLARLARAVLTSTPPAEEPPKPAAKKKRGVPRGIATVALFALTALSQACTTYRIVRWREAGPLAQASIFPQRTVQHADQPFRFAVAPAPRNDLDTVSVRDIDGRLYPFAEYMRRRHIRAFLVIRDDTIVYERYRDGYTDSTRANVFSVAKSFTSALLGLALEQGKIKSLDDAVTTYIPELAANPDFAGVTLRHLLGMQSGFAYTRTNGSLWHDFRSGDAHFYYTTDRHASLAGLRREDPPGTRWAYKDPDTDLIGWTISNATGRSLAQLLEEGVWKRIGAERDATWDLDHGGGVEAAASGMNATARDFAKFGRLYLNGGAWNGTQVLPRDWVAASTTLDRSRAEPEVATWWNMQHQHYWWLPMHNWDAERDFFADGSKGQRIYVSPPTHTVIVQLADESPQDFPFRKVAHYLAGQPYRYPVPIPSRLLQVARAGASADSVTRLYRSLSAREKAAPADFVISEDQMIAVGNLLRADASTAAAGLAVLRLSAERSPGSARSRLALSAAEKNLTR